MNKLKTALAKLMKRDENYELRKAIEEINKNANKKPGISRYINPRTAQFS